MMGWHHPHLTDHIKCSVNVCADCWITPLNRRVIADTALLEECREALRMGIQSPYETRSALLARLDERLEVK